MGLKGVYSRLVEAQGLKKQTGGTQTPIGISTPIPQSRRESLEKDLKEFDHVHEKGSGLDEPELAEEKMKSKTYSTPYLFMRMANVVRDEWPKYAIGAMFSIGLR